RTENLAQEIAELVVVIHGAVEIRDPNGVVWGPLRAKREPAESPVEVVEAARGRIELGNGGEVGVGDIDVAVRTDRSGLRTVKAQIKILKDRTGRIEMQKVAGVRLRNPEAAVCCYVEVERIIVEVVTCIVRQRNEPQQKAVVAVVRQLADDAL